MSLARADRASGQEQHHTGDLVSLYIRNRSRGSISRTAIKTARSPATGGKGAGENRRRTEVALQAVDRGNEGRESVMTRAVEAIRIPSDPAHHHLHPLLERYLPCCTVVGKCITDSTHLDLRCNQSRGISSWFRYPVCRYESLQYIISYRGAPYVVAAVPLSPLRNTLTQAAWKRSNGSSAKYDWTYPTKEKALPLF